MKTSRKKSKEIKSKIIYMGKLRKPSYFSNWFKHDILTYLSNDQLGRELLNEKNEDDEYIDPITFDPLHYGDDVVCLGKRTNKYYCFNLESFKKYLQRGGKTNPITREKISEDIIRKLVGSYKQHVTPARKSKSGGTPYIINNGYMYIGDNVDFDDIFNDYNNQVLEKQHVKNIIFGDTFNQSIDNIKWPYGIKLIIFGKHFNQPIDNVIFPDTLDSLSFGSDFNQPMYRIVIINGKAFTKHVLFPQMLRIIKFGDAFNQPIDKVTWPNSLRLIHFSKYFNQSLAQIPYHIKIYQD
jgi:hypothetical protein